MNTVSPNIRPIHGERPSIYAERAGLKYAEDSAQQDKKHKGQFFTPLPIADFMSSLATPIVKKSISILDPGCGFAILSCSLIEKLSACSCIKNISLVLFETDERIIPYIYLVLQNLSTWCTEHGISLVYHMNASDFVLTKCDSLLSCSDSLFREETHSETFDYIISNPPYFKLGKNDIRTRSCHNIVDGQTNIYSLFMAICAKLLSTQGQMIFITPRSFASGRYFQSFRDFIFKETHIDFIHLFGTRNGTFSKDAVLQELVITRMSRPIEGKEKNTITISFSQGISDLVKPQQRDYPSTRIIDPTSKEKVIYLPVNSSDEAILELFKSWSGNMEKYGIKISTGPVVAFRAYDNITSDPTEDTVPLYWLHNVLKMLCYHPVWKKGKGQYIRMTPETRAMLVPNKNYVLLRRFSSKDDNSRLIAAPYFGNMTQHEFVGIENKLNYIYRPKGRLRRDEVIGLSALLDSTLFDAWFRTFNGNTNVSATELRMMPLPPIETICEIGNKIILNNDYSIDFINDLVFDYFKIQYYE